MSSTIFSRLQLDSSSPIPLYYQLEQFLRQNILQGKLEVGSYLPPEISLVSLFSISRSTVRQAMNDLVNEGYLIRKKGCGTFVSKPKIEEDFFRQIGSFDSEMRAKQLTPTTKVLTCKQVEAVAHINEKLKLSPDESLLFLSRVRYANDVPIVFLETYLPYNSYAKLVDIDFSEASLYESMEKIYGARINRAVRNIEAVCATAKEASHLNTSTGAAILLTKSIGYLKDTIPTEFSVARYVGESNIFSIEVKR